MMDNALLREAGKTFDAIKREVHQRIVGHDSLIERLLVALVADGHVLLEGVPGLAKTKILTVLTGCLSAHMNRIQFTPDLLPSDLIGTEIFRPQTGEFTVRYGPIFTNLFLADEINRAPAKVQSALLQAMQEREVTIGDRVYPLPQPFLVLATQNPIEQEGTYELPEAQVDRFLLKVKVTYPSFDDELSVLAYADREAKEGGAVASVCSLETLAELRKRALEVLVDPKIERYIVSLVRATREGASFGLKGMIDWGASPRGTLALRNAARALSLVRGKPFVTPDEVKELAPDVLRHRVIPSFEADVRSVDSDEIVRTILKSVTVP